MSLATAESRLTPYGLQWLPLWRLWDRFSIGKSIVWNYLASRASLHFEVN